MRKKERKKTRKSDRKRTREQENELVRIRDVMKFNVSRMTAQEKKKDEHWIWRMNGKEITWILFVNRQWFAIPLAQTILIFTGPTIVAIEQIIDEEKNKFCWIMIQFCGRIHNKRPWIILLWLKRKFTLQYSLWLKIHWDFDIKLNKIEKKIRSFTIVCINNGFLFCLKKCYCWFRKR